MVFSGWLWVDSDAELVIRMRQGDIASFEVLYDRYKVPLYRTALAVTGTVARQKRCCRMRSYFKSRLIIVLYYLRGYGLREITYVRDCTVGTVKSRLHYACQALRTRLKKDRGMGGVLATAAV
jgi:DNA-directed RNA polymerase specialized sigma24 family protein